MDFTLKIYKQFLHSLLANDYSFQTLENFIEHPNKEKIVILRHDIDRLPENALKMAHMENTIGIKTSCFFRTVDQVFDETIIGKIVSLGHEVSYHYEDLSLCRGNYELAIKNFESNLEKFRKIYPVKTICMHGSPLSKWDNRDLWKMYDYRDYGIIAEPYFDVDFDEVFYLTDTGRSWNNSKASVRDKVNSKLDIKIKDTNDLIEKIQKNELPDEIMLNVHPHRWFDYGYNWYKELLMQNVKNQVKSLIVRMKGK